MVSKDACDDRHTSLRVWLGVLTIFLPIIMVTAVWCVRTAYSAEAIAKECRSSLHTHVEVQEVQLQRIDELLIEIKALVEK